MKLGNWGLVCGIYLICAAVTNAVFVAIGCRPPFLALALPCLAYLALLPSIRFIQHQVPSLPIFLELSLGGL
jgi:hypothetical protein